MQGLETGFEILALITASVALVLLGRARSTKSVRPAIITLYLCIGIDVAETLSRRFLGIRASAESATIETVTVALSVTALYYAIRFKKTGAADRLGLAITCMVWAVTIFGLELMLGFILSFFQ